CEEVQCREALAAATRWVKAAQYHGLVTVEFRRDPRDGKLYLINADPRVVRATSLSAALGMDTPSALYRLAVGDAVAAPQDHPDRIGWLWETGLLERVGRNRDSRTI